MIFSSNLSNYQLEVVLELSNIVKRSKLLKCQYFIWLNYKQLIHFFPSWWFNVGLVLFGVCISLAMFCIVYLDWFKGIQHYDHEYPAIPPIATAAFIAASCR